MAGRLIEGGSRGTEENHGQSAHTWQSAELMEEILDLGGFRPEENIYATDLMEVHCTELQKRKNNIIGSFDAQTRRKIQQLSAPPVKPRSVACYSSFKVPNTPRRQPMMNYNFRQDNHYENIRNQCGSLQDHNYLPSPTIRRSRNVKLINLSYSQPSTPKISFPQPSFPCQTPNLFSNRNHCSGSSNRLLCMPITPMLNDPLKVFNQPNKFSCTAPIDPNFVDILQMIDDDTNSVDFVDRKIDQYDSDVKLGDHNVADFLLDICEDYAYKPQVIQRPQFQPVTNVGKDYLNTKRKCKRAKPVSFEESEIYKEQKKQQQKARKKKQREAFQKPSLGLRRSQRSTRKIVSYKYS